MFAFAVLVVACGAFGASEDGAPASADASAEGAAPPDGQAPLPDAGAPFTDDAGRTCTPLVSTDFTSMPAGFAPASGNDGTVAVESNVVKSTPNALAASLTTTSNGNAQVERAFPLPGWGTNAADVLEVDYEVFLEANATSYAELGCSLEMRNPGDDATRLLLSRSSDGNVDSRYQDPAGGEGSATLLPAFVPGWFHVTQRLSARPDNKVHAETLLGAASLKGILDMPVPVGTDHVLVVCGIDYASVKGDASTTTVKVWIDDLTIRRCTGP